MSGDEDFNLLQSAGRSAEDSATDFFASDDPGIRIVQRISIFGGQKSIQHEN
jgi:hypothetical protein